MTLFRAVPNAFYVLLSYKGQGDYISLITIEVINVSFFNNYPRDKRPIYVANTRCTRKSLFRMMGKFECRGLPYPILLRVKPLGMPDQVVAPTM